MGPALQQRSQEISRLPWEQRRGYAAVANKSDIEAIHRKEGVDFKSRSGGVCPHAAAARNAARQAAALAEAHPPKGLKSQIQTTRSGRFDYSAFYANELDKKHKDKSYRYAPLWDR